MQVRELMGISELELEGRPDGSIYKGFDTVIDEVNFRIEQDEAGFSFSDIDLAELEKESKMFYYRYLLCFQISDFGRVVRDTEHNLKICEITEMYCSNPKMRISILQYRPFIVKMNAISRAMISLQKNVKELAKDILENAVVTLKALPDVNSSIFIIEKKRSINYLETALKQLGSCKNDSLECMKKELSSAVESEDYEKAADLRDRIKQLSKEIE